VHVSERAHVAVVDDVRVHDAEHRCDAQQQRVLECVGLAAPLRVSVRLAIPVRHLNWFALDVRVSLAVADGPRVALAVAVRVGVGERLWNSARVCDAQRLFVGQRVCVVVAVVFPRGDLVGSFQRFDERAREPVRKRVRDRERVADVRGLEEQ
jgi:hypothetical protein